MVISFKQFIEENYSKDDSEKIKKFKKEVASDKRFGVYVDLNKKEQSSKMNAHNIDNPDDRSHLKNWFNEIKQKRNKRKELKYGGVGDKLTHGKIGLNIRLQRFKENKRNEKKNNELRKKGELHGWTSSETERAIHSHNPNEESTRNNINATMRLLRKNPHLKEREYKSKDSNGRLTSRYFDSKHGEVRISNHELPTHDLYGNQKTRKTRFADVVVDHETNPKDVHDYIHTKIENHNGL